MSQRKLFSVMVAWVLFYALAMPLAAQYPNVRVSKPESTWPEEVTIAINPTNPQNLLAGANTRFVYYSTDAGATWHEDQMRSSLNVAGDPCVVFDAEGNAYYGHLSNPRSGYWLDRIVVQKSTDGGITWNDGAGVGHNPPKQQDKEWLAADQTESPFRHNLYMAWTEFDVYGSSNPQDSTRILFARSTDFGETWSEPVRVSDRGGDALDGDKTVEGAVPAVGPSGEVYLSWAGHNVIMFDKSTDGGQTFGRDVFVADQPGGWDFDVPGIFRCNGMPITACDVSNSPYRGTLYILWSDQRNGADDTDVFLIKSTNSGDAWSEIKRVNDDVPGRHQFFPWMTVDPVTGVIYVVFYDRRNTTGVATDVYVAKSTDGGGTFENFKVSESSFFPRSGVFFGDYINIAAYKGKVYPIWMRLDDTILSVWVAPIDDPQTHVAAPEGPGMPATFELQQNFPNPFNAGTLVRYAVSQPGHVKLAVYNALGHEIRTLVNTHQQSGYHRIAWDGRNARGDAVGSGIYLLRLRSAEGVQVRKMIVVR